MVPKPPPTIDDFGVRGCTYLYALLVAQDRRLPVAPTARSTLVVMDLLREHGLIEVPWPELKWPVQPNAEQTPIEQLQWRYRWDAYQRNGLSSALEEHLQSVPRDDYGVALRLQLWQELAAAEAEQFFEQQLIKHRFDPAWARDLVFVYRDTSFAMSIAQWRYCCWAATRHGASVAQQQQAANLPPIREAIYAELHRRVRSIGTGQWGNCSFPPFQTLPSSALARTFTQHLAGLGKNFWTLPPSFEALMLRTTA